MLGVGADDCPVPAYCGPNSVCALAPSTSSTAEPANSVATLQPTSLAFAEPPPLSTPAAADGVTPQPALSAFAEPPPPFLLPPPPPAFAASGAMPEPTTSPFTPSFYNTHSGRACVDASRVSASIDNLAFFFVCAVVA